MKRILERRTQSPSTSIFRRLKPASGFVVLGILAGCAGPPDNSAQASAKALDESASTTSSGATDDSAQIGTDSLDDIALITSCPDGSEPSSEMSGACAAIDTAAEPSTIDSSLPNLADLRTGAISPDVTCTAGGNQAGTFYDFSALPRGSGTDLQARMIVYPNGINNSTHCYIFTTATNRTQRGVEVVGMYGGAGTTPTLGVFDWSCTAGSPCGSDKSPSWVWSRTFNDPNQACYTHQQSDGHGNTVDVEYYSNKTQEIAAGSPPEWRNTVLLWNYCKNRWDQIYQHTYHETNADGGGWGPVVEPHIQGALPKIKEVGFLSSKLLHNGTWTTLGSNVTTFKTPAQAGMSNWSLMFRVPNSVWGIHGD